MVSGMADRGMGIRLFNSRDALQYIFDDFEDAEDDTEDTGTSVVTSQLRHFVVQVESRNHISYDTLLLKHRSTLLSPCCWILQMR